MIQRFRHSGAEAEALEHVRDAAFSQLAAGVAYELEALTSKSLAGVALALAATPEGSPGIPALESARSAMQSMAAVLRGLKAFTTEDAHSSQSVDVHEALELSLRLAGPALRERASLERRYAPTRPVRASIPQLARLFAHILRNAGESIPAAMPDANRVTIETSQDARGHVVVVISDTGVGIEPEDLPFVFDPFFTSKGNARTAGLGLTAARTEISKMGGEIEIESTAGRGTQVRITLPAVAASSGYPLRAPWLVTHEVPPSRILSVAASHAAALQVARPFMDGEVVVTAATWTEALERLTFAERFDLIVCDARSPEAEPFRASVVELASDSRGRIFAVRATARDDSGVFLCGDESSPQAASGE
jgi:CheY-like chemotaxis protein